MPSNGVSITATDGTSGTSNSFNVVELACPCTIWDDSALPDIPNTDDGRPIEVGVKFHSDIAGYITGIRLYKGNLNTETHIGHLWSSGGELLAEVSFSGETESGWQEALFDQPVQITANTTYVASYFSPSGGYSTTEYGLQSAVYNAPLKALASGEDGVNGLFRYDSSGFPTQTWVDHAPNYWVDVLFDVTTTPDTTPPVIVSTTPTTNESGVNVTSNIQVSFNEGMDANTINNTTVELRDSTPALVDASVTYNPITRIVAINPASNLVYFSPYTVLIKGGVGGVTNVAGIPLAADYSWNFTTSTPPPPPPNEGPGGPILVIADAGNPFGRYYAEILRAEGLNEFTVTDITNVNETVLNAHDVVILAELTQALTAGQVTLFTSWVTAGGNLIAMHPEPQLAGLLGLSTSSGTLSEAYLLVDTTQAIGAGIVGQTIQFHGSADRYSLNEATSLATLYSDATTPTTNPAVTLRSVGSNGGQAAAFTYDLAKSIVYTRQGNPAWAGQERDGITPIRSNDLFFGGSEPDWINLNKVAIPQADEQQRLLANMILFMNLDQLPLPRFWYFPRGEKAVVLMTADDHGGGDVTGRFDRLIQRSLPGCSVEDWECIRSSGYIYTTSNITDTQAAYYTTLGFEVGLHVNTGCADFNPVSLAGDYTTQLSDFGLTFPSIPDQVSERTHCIAWSDWASQPIVKVAHNIRLDTNYYYWFGEWVGDRPGFFTGSGMPMRFANLDGSMIDVYQATTQMTDESLQSYPYTINALLDRAVGPDGYYGVFTANIHTDGGANQTGSEAIVTSALARGIPVVSGRQLANWLDGRNGSSFKNLSWSANTLTFEIQVGAGANGLQVMLPVQSQVGPLSAITSGGNPVGYTQQSIKGINYAIFDAQVGAYSASYQLDLSAPVITNVASTNNADGTVTVTWTTDEAANSRVDYGTVSGALNLNSSNALLVSQHSITLSGLTAGTTYYFTVTSQDSSGNSATSAELSFIPTELSSPYTIFGNTPGGSQVVDSGDYEFGVKFRASVDGLITGVRFYKPAGATGIHTGKLWSSSGTLLASTQFVETDFGWQEVNFASPIPITANTTYIASYSWPGGYYPYQADAFSIAGITNGPLTALQMGVDGPNGVYNVTPGLFPTEGNGANYFADVLFEITLDLTPPVITNLLATPSSSGEATINWTTNELANSLVIYGTEATNLSLSTSDINLVTAHSLSLTGLSPSTTYYYRVTSTDNSGNSATQPPLPDVPASFTTPALAFTDTTIADFSNGTLAACYLAQTNNGELSLSPTVGAEFLDTSIPGGWSISPWLGGSGTTFNGNVALVDGALLATELPYFSVNRSIEFVATFGAETFQHAGFGQTFAAEQGEYWAMFSTWGTTNNLFARTNNNDVFTNTLIGTGYVGSAHRYRIRVEYVQRTILYRRQSGSHCSCDHLRRNASSIQRFYKYRSFSGY